MKKKILLVISLLIIIIIGVLVFIKLNKKGGILEKEEVYVDKYLASDVTTIKVYEIEENKIVNEKDIVRGTKVVSNLKKVSVEEKEYQEIKIDDKKYYIEPNYLVDEEKKVVMEDTLYVVAGITVLKDLNTSEIACSLKKNTEVNVKSFNELDSEGNVDYYYIEKDNCTGYIERRYLVSNKEEIATLYDNNMYTKVYNKVHNYYGGGEASKLDILKNEKVEFEDNKMPSSVYALYLNNGSNIIKNIDSYINFAKNTKINTFVIDIKDNTSPAYPAETFKKLSITNYKHAINSEKDYGAAIKKLKDNGFYVVGRISVFKDSYYVADNPNTAITNKNTGKPFKHNSSYWPSAYNRDVWYYTVSLAKESAEKFGFNEINFDYVRFPDRMMSVANIVNMKNTYNEGKVEAIERFLRYATDELHKMNVYVSADVFGESTTSYYTTAYGQYWPSITTIVDAISGMPYPDHFSDNYYGIKSPWNHPYELMKAWGDEAYKRQAESPSPAVVRTWIQAYDVMKYVDPNGIAYNSEAVEKEIRGLFDAKLYGGFITWNSGSSLEKYNMQKAAYQKDYLKEYKG